MTGTTVARRPCPGDIAERVRHAWELARPDDPDVGPMALRLMRSIRERARWRSELLAAMDRAAREPPDLPATQHSAQHDGEDAVNEELLTVS
ncbi:hypothetical protein AB0B97_17265 [Micromonospora sp. NPDC049004]|uniref:hypothetical protein n=1 Tax=Micromonospora sp. NPDC049004 TaxID=3154348 RepID=UPI0033EE9F7D